VTAVPEIDPRALENLQERVQGRVVAVTDPDWGAASLAWNLLPQAPLVVVEAQDADDVVATVRWARENGVGVAAQPRGHAATGTASGCVLLRTRPIDGVDVDPASRLARIGAGVTWGACLRALDGAGVLPPAGSNPDVSVVGYLLGGGLSWFSRLCGYAGHLLRAAEVVDAEGRLRWVSDESDPELMWALRGGGGDLVVVTQVELELLPAPTLFGGKLLFPIADASAVLDAFIGVTQDAPRALTTWATVAHFPDMEALPPLLRGGSFLSVDVTYVGSAEDGGPLLEPLRAAGTVLMDTVAPVPVGRLGELTAERTDPTPFLDRSSFLTTMTGDTVDRLLEAAGDRSRTALTFVQVRHVGGGLADPPTRTPAVADTVAAPYFVRAMGLPWVPDLVEPVRRSLAAVDDAVRPDLSDEPLPLNFLPVGEPLSRAFTPATLERLQTLKRSLDPTGTIRSNVPLLFAHL
jgi:hypothetical protein